MPDRPEVTVTDPHAPYGEPLPAPVATRLPRVVIALGAAVLALLLVGVLAVMGLARRNDEQVTAEGRLLRIGVVSAVPSLLAGQPAVDRRYALVELTLSNASPLPVRVLTQQLDGGPPTDPGPATTVAPSRRLLLHVRWRVRCSEVGNVFGPGFLSLTLRAPRGEHELRLALDASTARAFHLAAVRACGPT